MRCRVLFALSMSLYAFAGAGQPAVDAAASAAAVVDPGIGRLPYRRVTQQSFIALDDALLRAIGRANPHAALILCDFRPNTQPSRVSIVAGQAVMTGLPTMATLQLVTAGSSDGDALARSIRPMQDAGDYVETDWSSARTPSGDLAVTFATHVMGKDGVARGAAYPTIAMTVQNASPSKILGWRIVR